MGPNGNSTPGTAQTLDFFSETGGSPSGVVSSGNYVFADSGGGLVPQSAFSVGTYKPTSYASSNDTFFASPSGFYTLPGSLQYAATKGSSTLTAVYGGTNGNGTWSLYFNQNTHENGNGATNGWCLQFTENPPDLSVTSNNSPSTFRQGDTGDSINFTVTNNGPGSSGGTVTLTETVPTGLTVTGMSGSGWTCPAGQFPASSGAVSCTTSAIVTATSTYPTLTANVNVATNAASSVMNSATISGSMDNTAGDNTTTDTISVLAPAILTISKTFTGTFTQGQTAEWDVTIGNSAAAATDTTVGTVTMQDTLPAGYTVNAFTGTDTTTWSCAGTGTNTANCTTSVHLNGGGATYPVIHIIVNVPAGSPASVTNTADAFGGGDVVHTNIGNAITSSSTVTVVQVPASVTITSGGTQSAPVNTAFGTALGVVVKDAGGVVIQNQAVVFTAPPSGASGTFSNNTNTITANTNPSGQLSETFTANGTAGGPYTVSATAGTVSASPAFSLTNTGTSATVTNVSSITANGSYSTGAVINVTVTFSKAVNVTGTPLLALNSGGTAGYVSGSGTSTLLFSYTVAAGQNSAHLDYTSASALTLNGGTIQDSSNTPAILTLPAPGAPGSLSANTNIVIDTVSPTVVSYSVDFGSQTYNVIGAARTAHLPWTIAGITVTFSKPIASATAASLGGISATGFSGLGTSTLTWTFTGIINATLSTTLAGSGANAIKDAAGNGLSGGAGFTQGFSVLYGDFNGDGVVNAADMLGVAAATKEPYNLFADLNGDGVVNTTDAAIRKGTSGSDAKLSRLRNSYENNIIQRNEQNGAGDFCSRCAPGLAPGQGRHHSLARISYRRARFHRNV